MNSLAMYMVLGIQACSGGTVGAASGGGQTGSLGSLGSFPGDPAIYAVLGGFLLLAVASVFALALVATFRNRRPAFALMALLSPDGRYWWDGNRWHDRVVETPPQFLRSADGAHWWDGTHWWPLAGS